MISLNLFLLLTNPTNFTVNSLDYPGVGPEHSFLKDLGRAEYHSITDEEALEGIKILHFNFLSWVCQIFHSILNVNLVI